MRRVIVLFLSLASVLVTAQNTTLPKYRAVRGNPPDKAVPEMNAAADQGYRFLFGGQLSIMRLDTAPPDTYRYLPLPDSGLLNGFLNKLDQQGALGYGWLRDTKFLEKEPHPRNYEYSVAKGYTPKSLDRSKEELLAQGFHEVGPFATVHVYMREINVSQTARKPKAVRVVATKRKRNLIKDISGAALQGFCYRSPADPGMNAVIAVSMEPCGTEEGAPVEYREFKIGSAKELERDLNGLGQDGFHIVAESLNREPFLVERPAVHTQTYIYRVGEASDASAAEQLLNAGDRDGFAPVGFGVQINWNVHYNLILEKVVPAAAP